MATMPDLEMLLADEQDYSDPTQRKAMAGALRRQNDIGTLGLLMGVKPTMAAGASMQDQASQSLRSALAKQQAVKQRRLEESQNAAQQKRWEAEQTESKRRWGAEYGLSQEELKLKRQEQSRKDNDQGWKVRVDPYGNPLGRYNDRGDYMTIDGQFFPAPGNPGLPGGQMPRGGMPSAGGPPSGGGGGVQGQPGRDMFGMPQNAFTQPQPGMAQQQPQGMQISPEMQSSMRQGRIRSLPAEQQKAYADYKTQLSTMPKILAQVKDQAGAFGMFSDVSQYIPGQPGSIGEIGQKLAKGFQEKMRSPEETRARSAVYKQAYDAIHALAGSALSTGERQRLEAFLPAPTDPINKIVANLEQAYIEAGYGIQSFEEQVGVPQELRTQILPLEQVSPQQAPAAAPQGGNDDQIIDLPPRR